jgi:hypothetical protein
MGYIATNLAPILAATLAGLLLGALYAAVVRRPRPGEAATRPRWGLMLVAVVAEFWLGCILAGALILAPPGANASVMAIGSAVVIWIGFVLPTLVVSYGFRGQATASTVGDALHWLAVMVLQAAVLHVIGLTHP